MIVFRHFSHNVLLDKVLMMGLTKINSSVFSCFSYVKKKCLLIQKSSPAGNHGQFEDLRREGSLQEGRQSSEDEGQAE